MHPARIMDLGRLHPRAVRRDSPARQGARGAGRSLGGDAGRLVAGELTERHRQGAAASCLKAVLPPAAQGAVLKKFTCAALTFDVQGWSYNILNMRWPLLRSKPFGGDMSHQPEQAAKLRTRALSVRDMARSLSDANDRTSLCQYAKDLEAQADQLDEQKDRPA